MKEVERRAQVNPGFTVYVMTVSTYHPLFIKLIQFKLVYGLFEQSNMHLIFVPVQPGKEKMYQKGREANSLVLIYVLCLVSSRTK